MEAKNVLIAYASKYGATAEIAGKIAQVIVQHDLAVDILPVNQVKNAATYKAVVLGSAVYMGMWRREAVRFLKTNRDTLARRPTCIFSSGPTGEGDPVKLMKGWYLPYNLVDIVGNIRPRDVALFGGKIDRSKLNFLEKFMIRNVKAPLGDFRDWTQISDWANSIAEKLKQGQPA